MAIFTSHLSGSSGQTSLTGSMRILAPHGSPLPMILTASYASFGPAIGIGTSVAPTTTFAINSDLDLTDDATNSRFSIANTNAYVNVGTDTNNRGFMLWENGSSRMRFGTKQSGVNYFNTLHLKSGQVGIGGDAASGIDFHVNVNGGEALIGDNANPPTTKSGLYIGNTDTFVGFSPDFGGNFVMASTASVMLMTDQTIGAGENMVAMLTARNDVQDVRIEAPSGMNIDDNLSVTGSVYIKNNNTAANRLVVSGSSRHAVSIAPQGANNLQIDRDNTNARLALRRVDTSIFGNDEIGRIKIVGSENGGVTEIGGAMIMVTARQTYNPASKAGGDLSFLNTLDDQLQPVTALTFSGSQSNRAIFEGDIQTLGNIIRASDGGATITMDTSDNVSIAGDLTVAGGEILGPTGGTLNIYSDHDVKINIDRDGSDTDAMFKVQINTNTDRFTVDESGNTRAYGTMRIDGNSILASDGGTPIAWTTSDNVTIGNNLILGNNRLHNSDDELVMEMFSDQHAALKKTLSLSGSLTLHESSGAPGDVVAKLYASNDDGVLDLYNNDSVVLRLSAASALSSYVPYNFQVKQDLTVGDGTAADRSIKFDGNAQDYIIGIDDSTDSLKVQRGTVFGSYSQGIQITSSDKLLLGATDGTVYVDGASNTVDLPNKTAAITSGQFKGQGTSHGIFFDHDSTSQPAVIIGGPYAGSSSPSLHATIDGQQLKSGAKWSTNYLNSVHLGGTAMSLPAVMYAGSMTPAATPANNTTHWDFANANIGSPVLMTQYARVHKLTGTGIRSITTDQKLPNGYNYTVLFYYRGGAVNDPESEDALLIQVSTDGGSWTTLRTLTTLGSSTYGTLEEFDFLTSNGSYPASDDFYLRVAQPSHSGGTNDDWEVSNINIVQYEMHTSNSYYPLEIYAYFAGGSPAGDFDTTFVALKDNSNTVLGKIYRDNLAPGTIIYDPFTGAHKHTSPEIIDRHKLVRIDSTEGGISSEALYHCSETTTARDKAVLGISRGEPADEEGRKDVISLGNWAVLVCSEGGNIEIGDYLCSSNTPGHAMNQGTDQLMSYTAAKATEAVDWSTEPGTTKVISCTVHCG